MKTPKPKGTLIPIGGGEDKNDKKYVLSKVVEETKKRKPDICVITLATNLPEEVAADYKLVFRDLGIPKISIVHFVKRSEADTEENLARIRKADVVLFTGGDQLKLSSLLGGTRLMDTIKEKYYDTAHFVVAGTSAGAAAMSDTMIIAGESKAAMIKGELELTNGLDLIANVFIDTHFTQRGRFGRIIQTVTCNPGVLGIGLGEDTAIVIHRGEELEVVGTGLVVIFDGTGIDYTDLTEKKDGEPITVQGMKMHVLGHGKKFMILEKKIKETSTKQ